jgi:transposase
MGDAHRFPTAARFRSFTGLAPKASETGNTDRKGQPMSKAGNRLLRTTLVRAADPARHQDPQLARRRRRSRTTKGKAPQQVLAGHVSGAQAATRRPSPPASLGRQPAHVKLAKSRP